MLNVNINGTQNVLKAAYKYSRKVVLASTSEVYGRNPKIPFSEDDDRVLGSTRVDRWCYSTSKAAAEHFCFAYQRRGEPVTVIGDGKQTRCFTYVEDAIRATVEAGLKPEAVGQIFNIGSDREISILELAETMIRAAGSSSTLRFVKQEEVYGSSYEDVPRRVPALARMREVLGVLADTPLEKGLRLTIEWFRAGHGG